MPRFHFLTHWEVSAEVQEVYQIIKDSSKLCEWWPSVYLALDIVTIGDDHGIGKIVSLYTKGYLPYTLSWSFEVVEVIKNKKIAIRAFGDLNGKGVWIFEQKEETCQIVYDWDISFDKPYLSKLAWLLRPIFSFNHAWAMKKGLESIQLEIRRRRGEENVPLAPKALWV